MYKTKDYPVTIMDVKSPQTGYGLYVLKSKHGLDTEGKSAMCTAKLSNDGNRSFSKIKKLLCCK